MPWDIIDVIGVTATMPLFNHYLSGTNYMINNDSPRDVGAMPLTSIVVRY